MFNLSNETQHREQRNYTGGRKLEAGQHTEMNKDMKTLKAAKITRNPQETLKHFQRKKDVLCGVRNTETDTRRVDVRTILL